MGILRGLGIYGWRPEFGRAILACSTETRTLTDLF